MLFHQKYPPAQDSCFDALFDIRNQSTDETASETDAEGNDRVLNPSRPWVSKASRCWGKKVSDAAQNTCKKELSSLAF